MSQDSVEIVRRIYDDGLFDQDPKWLLDLATPDIEYVNPPEAVDPGVRRGVGEVMQAIQSISENFSSSRHELHGLYGGGDTVIAAVRFCAGGRGSETEVIQDEAHTWTLRNGKVARIEWGRDLNAALEAAGLSE
jgi:ketosteroid isomerase-like protein